MYTYICAEAFFFGGGGGGGGGGAFIYICPPSGGCATTPLCSTYTNMPFRSSRCVHIVCSIQHSDPAIVQQECGAAEYGKQVSGP